MKTLPHFHEIAPMRHIKEETSRQCTGCIHEINAAQMKSLSHKNMTGPGEAERQFPSTDKRRPISMPCSQAAQNLFDN